MSYWLEDSTEKWLGDFATNLGLRQLRENGPPSLRRFIEAGEADAALTAAIVAETENEETLQYIASVLRDAKPPIYITDGSEEVE